MKQRLPSVSIHLPNRRAETSAKDTRSRKNKLRESKDLYFFPLFSLFVLFDLFDHILDRRRVFIGNGKRQTLALKLKNIAVPFISRTRKISRTAKLLFVARDFRGVEFTDNITVLTVKFNCRQAVFGSGLDRAAPTGISRTTMNGSVKRLI